MKSTHPRTASQMIFYRRYGRQLIQALNEGKVEDMFMLTTLPGFIWPEDGTYLLAKQGYKRSFVALFEYMKYKHINGFTFHPDTIDICIKFYRSKLLSILASNGCPVTRENIVYAISKGMNHCLTDLAGILSSSFLDDLDLQLVAIRYGYVDTFKMIRRLQGHFHPRAIFEIIDKNDSSCLDYMLDTHIDSGLTSDVNILNLAASKNRTTIVRKLINNGFYFDMGLIEYAITNDADRVVEMLLCEPISVQQKDKIILFEWNPMYLNTSVSCNSYRTTTFLFEHRKNRNLLPSQVWPEHHLLYCIDTEWKIRSSASDVSNVSDVWIKHLNRNPFDCMKYAYDNGALASPLFIQKLKDLIHRFDLYPLLSQSKKEWIAHLEETLVSTSKKIEQSLKDLSEYLLALQHQQNQ